MESAAKCMCYRANELGNGDSARGGNPGHSVTPVHPLPCTRISGPGHSAL
jgi:hypothetical protein